jgi:hypothetical protein
MMLNSGACAERDETRMTAMMATKNILITNGTSIT